MTTISGKITATETQRKHQRIIDRLRDEVFAQQRAGVLMDDRVVWITPGDARLLLMELAEMEPMDEAGQAKAGHMRLIAGSGGAPDFMEGTRLWGAVIQIRRIVLVAEDD